MKITSDIYQVGGDGYTSPRDAAIYLITWAHRAALVDAGCGGESDRLLDNVRDCGVAPAQIERLLITHCHFDHTGGAAELKARLGLTVTAHALDAEYLETGDDAVTAASWYGASITPVTVDHKIAGSREAIQLGDRVIEAFHMPGHSPGSLVYMVESEGRRVLFGQDVHGPIDRRLLSSRADYRESLRRMAALEADILCEGHFGVIHGKSTVRAFIRSFL